MQIGCMLLCGHANSLPPNGDLFYIDGTDDMAHFRNYGG